MVNHPPQDNNNQTDDWYPFQIVCCICGGTGHYHIDGSCSVDQPPNTSYESADVHNENTSEIKLVKFILKPNKEGVKVLYQIQQATLQATWVISQQLNLNVEIVEKSEVIDLVGPANKVEIILNEKKINSLLDSGS